MGKRKKYIDFDFIKYIASPQSWELRTRDMEWTAEGAIINGFDSLLLFKFTDNKIYGYHFDGKVYGIFNELEKKGQKHDKDILMRLKSDEESTDKYKGKWFEYTGEANGFFYKGKIYPCVGDILAPFAFINCMGNLDGFLLENHFKFDLENPQEYDPSKVDYVFKQDVDKFFNNYREQHLLNPCGVDVNLMLSMAKQFNLKIADRDAYGIIELINFLISIPNVTIDSIVDFEKRFKKSFLTK